MKQIRYSIVAIALFLTTQIIAQKPIKVELVKLAETITIPPSTVLEAYTKCKAENGIDGFKFFGDVYDRLDRVTKDIYTSNSQQSDIMDKDKKAGEKAIAEGFGDMSTAEQAKYMKKNPALQNIAGVNASMLELAAKMEDPAFKKKFDAMSDNEKARVVMAYQKPHVAMSREQHTQSGIKTVMEAGKVMNKYNLDYKGQSLAADRQLKEKMIDSAERKTLEPIVAERSKLSAILGKGAPDWVGKKLNELIAEEWAARTKTYEKKLALYRESILALVSLYQLAIRPFDDFLARINYGERLVEHNEMKELAQLGGYQEGLLREIRSIQDLSSHITVSAANFYKEKMEAGQVH